MGENYFRNRALRRIKALISKTEENGASIQEAASALEKATSLMKEYFITINEVEDLDEDPIITDSTRRVKIKEDVMPIMPLIDNLLDTRHFYSSKEVTFVGYSTDVKLAIYLYNKIMDGLTGDLEQYKGSKDYSRLRMYYHGNTLRRDFITGWIYTISDKVDKLLSEREKSISDNNKVGLVLVKKERVAKKFSEFSVETAYNRPLSASSREAIMEGASKADEFNLQNDLDRADSNRLKRLE